MNGNVRALIVIGPSQSSYIFLTTIFNSDKIFVEKFSIGASKIVRDGFPEKGNQCHYKVPRLFQIDAFNIRA